MKRLENKVAIITGGASGIGKATAWKFLEEGAQVAVWDIDHQRMDALRATWAQFDENRLRFYRVNTTNLAEVEATAAQVAVDFGTVHILVNNAGITRDASLKKMSVEQWQQVIDVNLTGVFYCTKAVYPYMETQAWGRILSAASVVGLYGNFGQSNYVATKAGIIGMTKVWAREFGRKGITANAVAPGFIHTEMMDTIPETVLQGMRDKCPIPRLGKPEEIANAYVFLASEEAAFINGATLSVDGGLTV
ncbi:MAG TPA: beta-ketoacyl-ACP reductase [Saprospiraceae bacterium]|nr:beta-ketoacyl-ACP reductase [Saprospiraceae bacterium]